MRYKLEDVAKLAKVSKTTVSRVLNKRGYLSQQTVDRVYEAMKQLNYQPNAVAQQLNKQKTNIIGLLFPTVANPFFGELTEELEKRLYDEGFKVLVGNSMNNPEKEANFLNQLLSKQVDGLIVGTHNQGISEYNYTNLPVVAIDRNMNRDIPVIESDNYAGGVLATTRLIKAGAKKIIHTNGPTNLETPAKRRREAYEYTMKKNNLVPITITVDFNISYDEKMNIFKKMFEDYQDIEAIFASNDVDAALIIKIASELERNVPDDLRIIGYDGTKIIQQLLPSLTTIIQPIEEIAETAIRILKKRMNNQETKLEYILPVSLKEGETG